MAPQRKDTWSKPISRVIAARVDRAAAFFEREPTMADYQSAVSSLVGAMMQPDIQASCAQQAQEYAQREVKSRGSE